MYLHFHSINFASNQLRKNMKRSPHQSITKREVRPVMTQDKTQNKKTGIISQRLREARTDLHHDTKNVKLLKLRGNSNKHQIKKDHGQVATFSRNKSASSFTRSSNASNMNDETDSKSKDKKSNSLTYNANKHEEIEPITRATKRSLNKRDDGVIKDRNQHQSLKNASIDVTNNSIASDNTPKTLELTSTVSYTHNDFEQERMRRVSSRRMSQRISQYSVLSSDCSPNLPMIKHSILDNLPRKSIAWAPKDKDDIEPSAAPALPCKEQEDTDSSSLPSAAKMRNSTETSETSRTSRKESSKWFRNSKNKVSSSSRSSNSSSSESDKNLQNPIFSKLEVPTNSPINELKRTTKETLESNHRNFARRKKSRIHRKSYGRKAQLRQKSSKKRKKRSWYPKDDSSSPIGSFSQIMAERSRSMAGRQSFAPRHSIFVSVMDDEGEPCPYDEPQLSITSSRQDLRSIGSMSALFEAMFSTSQFREMYGDGVDQMSAKMHCMFNANDVMEYYRNINKFNFSLQHSDFGHMYVEDVKRFNEKIRRFLRKSKITINDPTHIKKITRTLEREKKVHFNRKKNFLRKRMHMRGHELQFDETSPFAKYFDSLSKLKLTKSEEYKRKQMYSFVHNPLAHTYSMECLSQNTTKHVRKGRRLGQAATEIRDLTEEKLTKSRLFAEKKMIVELQVSDIPSFQRGKTIDYVESSQIERILRNSFTPKYSLLKRSETASSLPNSSSFEVADISMDSPHDSFTRIQ